MTGHIARLHNSPPDNFAGWVGDRFCYSSRMAIVDTDIDGVDVENIEVEAWGTPHPAVVAIFDIDYFTDDHDDDDIDDVYHCPNLVGYGAGVTLVHDELRRHRWRAVGEPWEAGENEYVRVEKIGGIGHD